MRIQNKHYTSIWLTDEDELQIIDQTKLPYQFEIATLKSNSDVCRAISSMQVRGAGLIGVTAGYGVYLIAKNFPKQKNWKQYMREECDKLLKTRPTAKNLSYALEQQTKIWQNAAHDEALPKLRKKRWNLPGKTLIFVNASANTEKKSLRKSPKGKTGSRSISLPIATQAGWRSRITAPPFLLFTPPLMKIFPCMFLSMKQDRETKAQA